MSELLAVFPGIHQTLSAEERLKSRGVSVSLVPTPPVVTSGCSFSIAAPGGQGGRPAWWIELGMPGVLYRISRRGGDRIYEEIDRREGAGVPPAGHHVQEGPG